MTTTHQQNENLRTDIVESLKNIGLFTDPGNNSKQCKAITLAFEQKNFVNFLKPFRPFFKSLDKLERGNHELAHSLASQLFAKLHLWHKLCSEKLKDGCLHILRSLSAVLSLCDSNFSFSNFQNGSHYPQTDARTELSIKVIPRGRPARDYEMDSEREIERNVVDKREERTERRRKGKSETKENVVEGGMSPDKSLDRVLRSRAVYNGFPLNNQTFRDACHRMLA